MTEISVMMKPSSGMCNMACDYCFYCDETQKRIQESYGFMSEETLRNIIRKTMINAEIAVNYACLDPLGDKHGKTEYGISAEQYGGFLVRLFELWYRDLKKNRQPYIRQFENYIMMLLGYPPEACDQRGTCGLQYVVEADGGVYPCDFYMLDEYRIGNFNENTMKEMDEKRKHIGFIERSWHLESECRQCRHFYLCRGGCQRHRDLVWETGKFRNYLCEGYKVFFDKCSDRMLEIANSLR